MLNKCTTFAKNLKIMKKIFLLLSIVGLTTASCSNNDETPAVDESSILPKKIVNISDEEGIETVTITYNGKKVIESNSVDSNGNKKDVFTYNGDLITKIETFKGTVLKDFDEFQYDGNNRLIVVLGDDQSFDLDNNPIRSKTKKTYTYNADGTVLETNFKLVNTTYVATGTTALFTVSNGNEVKKVTYSSYLSQSGPSGETITVNTVSTTNSEYDNKNNPLKNILGLDKIILATTYSVNNLTKAIYSSISTPNIYNQVSQPRITNFQLTYNANNFLSELKFPYTVTSTVNQVTTTITKTETTQYFYE